MDEILTSGVSFRERLTSSKSWESLLALRGKLQAQVDRFRDQLPNRLYRWDEFKRQHSPKALPFLAAALTLGIATTAVTMYAPGYAVRVDGYQLGVVADKTDMERLVKRVERRTGEILGREYTLNVDIDYSWRIVEKNKLSTLSGFETYLFNQVDEVDHSFVLRVDGQTVGVQADSTALQELLDSLKNQYRNEHTVVCDFTVPVEMSYEYVGSGQESDMDELTALLTSNTVEPVTYTVKAGDTYSGIARKHDMKLAELMAMNPKADASRLMPGDVLTVSQSVPYLPVRTVDQLTYQETIKPQVTYVEDNTMYQGDTKVLNPGVEGSAQVTARITYLNGLEQERDVTDYRQLTAPKDKVVAKGTKERPKTMAKGKFTWPVRGVITSPFGGRTLFGTYRMHKGIDISVPYGTSIKAADGGKVVFSGWDSGYGYYIIIDHENGKQTYYAHNSKLLVSVGTRVYQGQVIAKAGSTGRSTGPHCHFEVRVGGQPQNPRNYLP